MILDQLISTVSTAGLISAIVAFLTSKFQSKATVRAAQIGASAQNNSIAQQHVSQIELERLKLIESEQQQAFQSLGGWLYDLELLLNDIWDGLHSTDTERRSQIRDLIQDLPWGGRLPPREVAQREYFWDDHTRTLVSDLNRILAKVYNSALGALPQEDTSLPKRLQLSESELRETIDLSKFEFQDARHEFERHRGKILSHLHHETFRVRSF